MKNQIDTAPLTVSIQSYIANTFATMNRIDAEFRVINTALGKIQTILEANPWVASCVSIGFADEADEADETPEEIDAAAIIANAGEGAPFGLGIEVGTPKADAESFTQAFGEALKDESQNNQAVIKAIAQAVVAGVGLKGLK